MRINDRQTIIELTPLWKGERFPDGRPKVPQKYLDEMLDMLTKWIRTDPRGEKYRYLDWSHEYDLARNGDPRDTQTML